jgi:hypothetical protein
MLLNKKFFHTHIIPHLRLTLGRSGTTLFKTAVDDRRLSLSTTAYLPLKQENNSEKVVFLIDVNRLVAPDLP